MTQKTFRPVLAGAVLALSSALMSAGAMAQQPAAASGSAATTTSQAEQGGKSGKPGAHHRGGQHGKFEAMRGGILVPGLGPVPKKVVEELKLSAAQQKQLDETRASQRELGKAMREAGKGGRDTLKSQLEAGKLDPRALLAQRESHRGQFEAQHKAQQDRWLSLWDSLDATQQAKVAEFVKSHHERRAQRASEQRKPPAA